MYSHTMSYSLSVILVISANQHALCWMCCQEVIENSDMNKAADGISLYFIFEAWPFWISRTIWLNTLGQYTDCWTYRQFNWLFKRVHHLKWESNFVHLRFTRFHIGRLSQIGVRTCAGFQDSGLCFATCMVYHQNSNTLGRQYWHAPQTGCIFLFLSTHTFRTVELDSYVDANPSPGLDLYLHNGIAFLRILNAI